MKFSAVLAAGALTIGFACPTYAAGDPSGLWVVADHSAVVRIEKCKDTYCGFVEKGQPGKDIRNPDPAKRNRSVIGIEIMFNMKQSGPSSWSGETYNTQDGQIYLGKITPSGDELLVEGCVPGGGVCGSQTWKRYK